MAEHAEIVIVGGGLHGGMVAWELLDRRPATRLVLVERADVVGGNHTWCAFGSDVPPALRRGLEPLIEARWDGYDVRFPRQRRTIPNEYLALTSERFDRVVRARIEAAPNAQTLLGTAVERVARDHVQLADGRRLRAGLVVDARGPTASDPDGKAGFQKFVGLEVQLARPAGVPRPVVMDATVPQTNGYRFVYVLPFAPDRLLVEDTFFSDSPHLDVAAGEAAVRRYCAAHDWDVVTVVRRETGVLPMPWGGTGAAPTGDGPLVVGYRGGWFHPGTGYSLPWAVRVADAIAAAAPASPLPALRRLARAHARQAAFARVLNFGLFLAVRPADRWRLLERFYQLPDDTIARFYPLQSTVADRARMLAVNAPEFGALTGRLRELLTPRTTPRSQP